MDESVQRILGEIEKTTNEGNERKQLIEALTKEFPDLKISTDRWRRQRYSSKSVNARATKVDFRHNCGCCNDSPLEARPYIEVMGTRVFSDPDCFMVGEKNVWSPWHDDAYPDWRERLEKHGISQKAIDRVGKYLEAHEAPDPPEWDDDDD